MKVIGVKPKKYDNIQYYLCEDYRVTVGYNVIVETPLGLEFAKVLVLYRNGEKNTEGLNEVVRVASFADLTRHNQNLEREEEAKKTFVENAKKFKLEMKLINVRFLFDASKIIFYFTAEGRVDFREFVKDLAMKYRVRIELRQIGVRDETKMVGGIGICGRKLCCCSVLDDFKGSSINMAKEQNLSLNPTKISGSCGRLMCCLEYENEGYAEINRTLPRVYDIVKTEDGEGTVIGINSLKKLVKVSFIKHQKDDEPTTLVKEFKGDEVKVVKKGAAQTEENLDELKKLEDKNEQ